MGKIISVASLLVIETTKLPAVPVLRVMISLPAFSLPSNSETGLTTAESAGPSLSAITSVFVTTPPFPTVELQPQELR